MEPLTAIIALVTGALTAGGGFVAARASAKRERAEATVSLEKVVDERMALVLERQDQHIDQLKAQIVSLENVRHALEAETAELKKTVAALERYSSRLLRALKPYDPDTTLEVESEMLTLRRASNGK